MKKSELRKEIKNRKRQFTSQQLSELSFAVIMRLLAHQRLKDAHTVMLYYSLPDEVYTHTLVDALLASGKRVLLPRVTGEGTMELRLYTGPQSLEQGAYNIMEPVGEVFTDYAQIDLAVIPGVRSTANSTAWDAARVSTTDCCRSSATPTRLASASTFSLLRA